MRSLHRSVASVVFVFVIILSVTGILLNHTSELKLDQRYLRMPWLLEHYEINQVKPDAVFLLDGKVFSQFGDQLFVDAVPVSHIYRPLLGGVVIDEIYILATDDALILLNPDGEFVERMGAESGVPPMIQNIGLFHGDPVLQTRDGMWLSDFLLDSWELVSLEGVGWSVPEPMPDSVEKDLVTYFHGYGVTFEQVVLDIHNGRIIKKFGVWVLDAVGVLMILLSLSGLWLWFCKRKSS
jgi:hypothetical protein